MPTECISDQLEFEGFEGRREVAAFDGGRISSDAGALLLRRADRAIGLIDRVAACFCDGRAAEDVVHSVRARRQGKGGGLGALTLQAARHRPRTAALST